MAAKDMLGRYGEDAAARRLMELGWTVLARNWRCVYGEIDIVAVDGDQVVFVEVKTRRSDAFGGPLAAVTPNKVRRLRALAGEWLASQAGFWPDLRIDVIGVMVRDDAPPQFEHVRGIG